MATANLVQTSVSGGTQNALALQGDGVFFPKASTVSRLALTLTTTDKGFIVYDTTDNNIYLWNGSAWESIPSSGDAGANGSVQYNDAGTVSGATNFVYDKVTGLVTGIRYISTSSNAALPSYAVSAGNGIYNSGANQVGFAINGANAMTLNASGNLAFPDSKGIDFSATPGTGTSELLNDYEEGTWTIGLTFGGGSTGLTTALNTGRYTKVGRQVTVCGRLELSNKGSSTGAAAITGLPFSIASGNDSQQAASFRFNGVSYTGAFQGYGALSSTSINLEQISEAGSPTDITDSNFSNGTSIQISFTYTI